MSVINDSNQSQNLALLLSVNTRTQLFLHMMQSKGVPAKQVSGLMLEDQRRRQQLNPYVQVYQDGEWVLFDVENNKQGRPENLVLWQHNGLSVLDVTGGVIHKLTSHVTRDSLSLSDLYRYDDEYR